MIKKIFCLLGLLFLVSGCDVTYELNIDGDELKEKTDIVETNSNNLNLPYLTTTYQGMFDEYIKKPIPISIQDEIQPDSDEELPGVVYYKKKDISDNNQTGFRLTGKFNDNTIRNSTVINDGYNRFLKAGIDGHIVLSTGERLKAFDQYLTLDNVTIKIKTNHEVIKHNADEVKKGTYIWHIDRSNYTDKAVYFEIKEKIPTKEKSFDFNLEIKSVLLILGIVIALVILIFIVITVKRVRNNKL